MNKRKSIFACFLVLLLLFSSFCLPLYAQEETLPLPVRRHRNEDMKIAITFDDGPHPRYTDRILDILEKYEIKATFFIIGQNAEYYPEPLQRAALAGHEIGNHTYTHCHIEQVGYACLEKEYAKCQQAIQKVCGATPKLFRPPEGLTDNAVRKLAAAESVSLILWDIDTRDWAHPSSDLIVKRVLGQIQAGDIILMHDYVCGESQTVEALRILIPALLAKGYTFVTVSELLET